MTSIGVTIGGPLPTAEPPGLLVDCHRRIEAALGVLVGAALWPPNASLAPDQRTALARALQFFREMAPKHTADEEQSLFPRMRASGEALPELDALESDHAAADNWHVEIDQIGHEWLTEGSLDADRRAIFQDLTGKLAALYQRHIAIEDNFIFPKARRQLTPQQQEQVRREMVARRAIQLSGAGQS